MGIACVALNAGISGFAVGFVFDAFQCKIQRGQVVSELRGVEAFKGKRKLKTLMR